MVKKQTVLSGVVLCLLFLSGCLDMNSLGIAKVVKPEEIKRYKPKGVLVAIAVNKESMYMLDGMVLMAGGGADVTVYTSQEQNYVIADMSQNTKSIARIGMIFTGKDSVEWYKYSSPAKFESNKINYLGHFIFQQDTRLGWDRMIITNNLKEDREAFLDIFPAVSNMEFVDVGISNGTFTTVYNSGVNSK